MIARDAITAPLAHTRRTEFFNGVKDTFPLIVGAIPFGIIFGALAVTNGLSPAATLGMSLLVFAGSAQFIAAGLVAQDAGLLLIVFTTWIINLRHALYSASLGVYLKGLSQRWLLPLAFWLTDETYAVVVRRYPQGDGSPYKHWYQLGSSLAMYGNWQVCTLLGIVAGTQLSGLTEWGLDFAMVVTFIGIVVPLVTSRPMAACWLVASVAALLFYDPQYNSGLVIASLLGIAAGMAVTLLQARRREERAQ